MYNRNKKIKCMLCGHKTKIISLSFLCGYHKGMYYCSDCRNKLHYLYGEGLLNKETIDKMLKKKSK